MATETAVPPPDSIPRPRLAARAKKYCYAHGHHYEPIDESDHRQTVDADTYVRRSYICVQCGDVISPVIAVWENWIRKKGK